MLAESIVLAGGGAVLGIVFAKLGIVLLLRIAPANLPRVAEVSIDPMVLGFTWASRLSGVVFGILPGAPCVAPNLAQTLARADAAGLGSGSDSSERRDRRGRALVRVARWARD